MAAGKSTRWNGEVPKHLIRINNEPLLARTVRLLGDEDIYITSDDSRYNFAKLYSPKDNQYEIDRYLNNREIWADKTVWLYGDVFYTPEVIKKIKETPIRGTVFFGRRRGNDIKKYGEIFAVGTNEPKIFEHYCQIVRRGIINGTIKKGIGWDLWRAMGKKGFVELGDERVEDFDTTLDLANWRKKWESTLEKDAS